MLPADLSRRLRDAVTSCRYGCSWRSRGQEGTRDELIGKSSGTNFRRAGVAQKIDFVSEAKINGRYAGTEALFGALPEHCFELGAEL